MASAPRKITLTDLSISKTETTSYDMLKSRLETVCRKTTELNNNMMDFHMKVTTTSALIEAVESKYNIDKI